jgi:hypothetical protein
MIAILETREGFRKSMFVESNMPVIYIPLKQVISISFKEHNLMNDFRKKFDTAMAFHYQNTIEKEILFYKQL